jgi:hypothetical protein
MTALRLLAGAAALAISMSGPAGGQELWRASSLFEFDGASGYSPNAGVVAGLDGVVYGTTTIGGTGPCIAGAGCGTVYALAPPAAPGEDFDGGAGGHRPTDLVLAPDATRATSTSLPGASSSSRHRSAASATGQ